MILKPISDMRLHCENVYKLCLFLFLLSSSFMLFAEEKLVQQVIVYSDTAQYQYTYLYNLNGQKIFELESIYQDGSYTYTKQIEWVYQGMNCISQTHRKYINNNWEKNKEILSEYTDEQLTQTIEMDYSVLDNGVPVSKVAYTYNNKLCTKQESLIWENNEWKTTYSVLYTYADSLMSSMSILNAQNKVEYQTTYTYTSNKKPLQQTICQNINDSLINLHQYNWTYNTAGQLIIAVVKNWQLTDAGYAWVNSQKTNYEYNDTLLTTETYQYWNSEFWENNIRYTYTYLANGAYNVKTLYFPLYNKWRNISSINYSYETTPRKETILAKYEYWGGDENTAYICRIPYVFNETDHLESKIGNKIEVLYRQFSDLPTSQSGISVIAVYPNPSNGFYYIDTQKYHINSWTVCSLNGTVIAKRTNHEQTGIIDIANQQQGIYLLQVTTDEGLYTLKLIKE